MKVGRKEKGVDVDMRLTDSDTNTVINHIRNKGKIIIGGLGTFEVIRIKPKTMYHNTAKKTITTKGHNKLKYTPTSILKTLIN